MPKAEAAKLIDTELSVVPINLTEIDTAGSSFSASWYMAWTFVWPESAEWKVSEDTKTRKYFDVHTDAVKALIPAKSFSVLNAIEVQRHSHDFYGGESQFLVFHTYGEPQGSVTFGKSNS